MRLTGTKSGPAAVQIFRAPSLLKTQAMRSAFLADARFVGYGALRTCSRVKVPSAGIHGLIQEKTRRTKTGNQVFPVRLFMDTSIKISRVVRAKFFWIRRVWPHLVVLSV